MQSASEIVQEMYEGNPDEIVPNCVIMVNGEETVLYPWIAAWRNKLLAQRAQERAAWLAEHNYPDHAGCHNCGGYGRDHRHNMACYCDAGTRVLAQERRDEQAATARARAGQIRYTERLAREAADKRAEYDRDV